ncbi:MAG: hypothetical protein R6U61_04330 [Thermoplasmata archaeon]
MTELVETYCTNEDVEMRLNLGENSDECLDLIRDVRQRAYRWIRYRYGQVGRKAPAVGSLDVVEETLKDVEADRASYYYLRDKMEWASEPSSILVKMKRWKTESDEMLEGIFRAKYGDELYVFPE